MFPVCSRHVLLSSGPVLTESMWSISATCLAHAVSVTTHNLHQLMALFHPNSDNFYGDIGQVKVATRKDCVAMDNMRLKQLARQVRSFKDYCVTGSASGLYAHQKM